MRAKPRLRAQVYLLSLVLALGFSSCTNHALLDENETIADNVWAASQRPEFSVDIRDASAGYDLYLNLRNTPQYPFSRVYVLVHMEKADRPAKRFRVGLKLADRDGLWTGKSAGSLYAHQALFLRNFHFPDTGTYRFVLESNMRLSPLPGISDVGLRISPAQTR